MGSVVARSRGFTLIELMLVMLVLSVMLSLASAVLPDRNAARLANEAARLIKVLDTLQMEAMLQGTQAGLVLQEDGYHGALLNGYTLEWDAGARRLFSRRHLQAQGLRLELLPSQAQGERHGAMPSIVFDASGVSDPFTLRLADTQIEGLTRTLSSDGLQRAELQ
jgi:general secretion pathway protein H